MEYFPIFLQLTQQRVLVVGAGDVAARKVGLLLKAGADVFVVAPQCCGAILSWRDRGEVSVAMRTFCVDDLHGVALVIAATNDANINAQVSELAKQRHLPVNVVDSPALCSFVMPAIIDRSPLMVAVSSGGSAPVLARMLRARLEALIPMQYGRLAQLAAVFRQQVKDNIVSMAGRRRFWESVFEGRIGGQVLAGGDISQAEQQIAQLLSATDPALSGGAQLTVIGIGSDDVEMLSLKASREMQKADWVFVDEQVDEVIVEWCRRDAQRQRVSEPNWQYWADLAKTGKRIVYLTIADVATLQIELREPQLNLLMIPATPTAMSHEASNGAGDGWQQLMRSDH
ncbi:MAG: SAM-dependent methyltransferase [Gammaproteobacteria bacterium]|nr:SAM-dependent methyltransferase [Gammaproteobacteria bacterium]